MIPNIFDPVNLTNPDPTAAPDAPSDGGAAAPGGEPVVDWTDPKAVTEAATQTPGDPAVVDANGDGQPDPEESIVELLDELETKLDEQEQYVAEMLVRKTVDIPLESDQIKLSENGDTTRDGNSPSPVIPVTAAVTARDLSPNGGFDALGKWHDGGNGQYAKPGWSTAKAAVLRGIRNALADVARTAGDVTAISKRDHPNLGIKRGDRVNLRFHSPTKAVVVRDGRRSLIDWDGFEAFNSDRPDRGVSMLAPDADGLVTQDMAARPAWHTAPPATVEGAKDLIGTKHLLRNTKYAGEHNIIEATPAEDPSSANEGWYHIRFQHGPVGAPLSVGEWFTRSIDAFDTEAEARAEAKNRRKPPTPRTPTPLYGDFAQLARWNGIRTDGTGRVNRAEPVTQELPVMERIRAQVGLPPSPVTAPRTGYDRNMRPVPDAPRQRSQRGREVMAEVEAMRARGERLPPLRDAPEALAIRDSVVDVPMAPPVTQDMADRLEGIGLSDAKRERLNDAQALFSAGREVRGWKEPSDGSLVSVAVGLDRFEMNPVTVPDGPDGWVLEHNGEQVDSVPVGSFDEVRNRLVSELENRARSVLATKLNSFKYTKRGSGLDVRTAEGDYLGFVHEAGPNKWHNPRMGIGKGSLASVAAEMHRRWLTQNAPVTQDMADRRFNDRVWSADEIRTGVVTFNEGFDIPETEIANGTPVIRVGFESDSGSGKQLKVTRTPGIVTDTGGFISAAEPDVWKGRTPVYGAEKHAEWYGRKASGGVPLQVYNVEARSSKIVPPKPSAPVTQEMVSAPETVRPWPAPDRNGAYPTVNEVTPDMVLWTTMNDPETGKIMSSTSIVGQAGGGTSSGAFNETRIDIYQDNTFSWKVDAANPEQGAGTVDAWVDIADWEDPETPIPWAETGDAATLEAAQAAALEAVNRLAVNDTFKPVDTTHDATLIAVAVSDRNRRMPKPKPDGGYTGWDDTSTPVTQDMVVRTPPDKYVPGEYDGYQAWIADRQSDRQSMFAEMSTSDLVLIAAADNFDILNGGTPSTGMPTGVNPNSGAGVTMSPRDAMIDLVAERALAARELRSRGQLPAGVGFENWGISRPDVVVVNPSKLSTPVTQDLKDFSGNDITDQVTPERLAAMSFDELQSTYNHAVNPINGTNDESVAAWRAIEKEVRSRGAVLKATGTGWLVGRPEDFVDIPQSGGPIPALKPDADRGDGVARVAPTVDVPGVVDVNVKRVSPWSNSSVMESNVGFKAMNAPLTHGAVVIRGTQAVPVFDATSVTDAIEKSRLVPSGGSLESQQGKFWFASSLSAYRKGEDVTRVVVLDKKSAERWKNQVEGIQTDIAAFKSQRAAVIAARKAAREARRNRLPDGNDSIDMPPFERARTAPDQTAWVVAKDNYLSRVGVKQGQAVQVRFVDDKTGEITVLDGGTTRPQTVKWERFTNDAPGDASKVETPEVSGNTAVAAKAEAAAVTAARVQAAGDTGAPVEVADNYLKRYGINPGDVVTVSYLDEKNAVFNHDGRQIKAGWARFTNRTPEVDGNGWALIEPENEPVTQEMADRPEGVAGTILAQIGTMTVMAISGGRHTPIQNKDGETVGVRMPVAAGYKVDVTLDADDTYTVNRVLVRGNKETVKGTVSGVYADQVSDVAYLASNWRDKFGSPAQVANAHIDNLTSLGDMSPREHTAITRGNTVFTSAGWTPTQGAPGVFVKNGVTVRRDRSRGDNKMVWVSTDNRGVGDPFRPDSVTFASEDPDAVAGFVDRATEWAAVTPVDTAPLIDDRTLAEFIADPDIEITGAQPNSLDADASFTVIARSSDGVRVNRVLGRSDNPAEARGMLQDIQRRIGTLPATEEGATLVDDATRRQALLRTAAEIKVDAVKPGDWVDHVDATGVDLPDNGARVTAVNKTDTGVTVTTTDGTFTAPTGAVASVLRPAVAPEAPSTPVTQGFRPSNILVAALPHHFKMDAPKKQSVIDEAASIISTGVWPGPGPVPTRAELEAMTPSELRRIIASLYNWLAAHPYGDESGVDLFQPMVAAIPSDTTMNETGAS